MSTALHLLADQYLGEDGPLEVFVERKRDEGRPWRLIARDLYDATKIDVTAQTLLSWFPNLKQKAS